MKENKSIDSLFLATKEIPLELSLKEVETLVLKIPHLPIVNKWSKWFNLKTMIMNSVIISAMIGSLIWFNNLTNDTHQFPESIPLTTIETPVEEPDKNVENKAEIQESEPAPSPNERPEVKTQSLDAAEATPINEPDPTPSEIDFDASIELNSISTSKVDGRSAADPLPNISNTALSRNPGGDLPEITGPTARKLKRELFRNLRQDEILSSRETDLKLEFSTQGIKVNGDDLGRDLREKYTKILKTYGINPGNDRQVRISPEYIMVGDFSSSGFKGSMTGSVDMDELYSELGVKPWGNAEGDGGDFFGDSNEVFGNEGDLFGDTSDFFGDTNDFFGDDGKLFDDNSDELFQGYVGYMDTGDGYGDGNCQSPVELKGNQLKQFKRELMNRVAKTDLFSNDNPRVIMQVDENEFLLNKLSLNSDRANPLRDIILEYGVSFCEGRYILLSKDAIMILDFAKNGNFIGGTVSTEKKVDFEVLKERPYSWIE